jgi:5-(carboxyamino)imidazole ribonucleotide mutase
LRGIRRTRRIGIMARTNRSASTGRKTGRGTIPGTRRTKRRPAVGIIMGSTSDWDTMRHAAEALDALGVPHEVKVVSAHRTPDRLYRYAKSAAKRGLKVIVAGAGGAAHLPGMAASMTMLPVFGVPVESKTLTGLDSLLSIAQMPGGIPVGTLAIGSAGAKNAGLLAAAVVALSDARVAKRLAAWRRRQTASVPGAPAR